MKVLYIARLFSGLETSMVAGRWQPTGVPTIYKMIEALDANADLELVLAKKAGFSVWKERGDRDLSLAGLKAPVTVLAGADALPSWLGRLRQPLSELRQLLRILAIVRRTPADVLYIDHGNVWAAGILARICRTPVLFRVMGVYPAMREALSGPRMAHAILRWCYRAPYAAVVCTQDGSGIEPWLATALDRRVPCHAMVNGADRAEPRALPASLAGLPADRTVAMFLGKMETAKGCDQFLDAFLRARAARPGGFHALMVGAGRRLADLRARVAAERADADVTFIERMPHADVMAALQRADIYVSLNRLGNLSNANLEAMRLGACMVFPASQPEVAVDVITDRLIPADAVRRIPSADDVEALARALLELGAAPELRARMREAVRTAADGFLTSWNDRIGRELDVVRELAGTPRNG